MPGGKGKIKPQDNPKPFKKGDARINRKGRPKKIIGTVNEELKQKGYAEATKEEITSCYLRLINLEIQQLERMVKDKKQPALITIVGKNILTGKGFEVIEKLLV